MISRTVPVLSLYWLLCFAMICIGSGCVAQKPAPSPEAPSSESAIAPEGQRAGSAMAGIAPPPAEPEPAGKQPSAPPETTKPPPSRGSGKTQYYPDGEPPKPVRVKGFSQIPEGRRGKPAAAPGAEEKEVVLNFDNADLYEVIRTIAEILEINYIVDPNVRGNVTIHTAGAIQRDELFDVFFQILEANGLTALREGSLYKIDKLKEAPRMPLVSGYGMKTGKLPPGERVVMQIIPLQNISAEEMTKLLTPFISAEGTIISHGDSNTLLVVDKLPGIKKALRLVRAFDVDVFDSVGHRFFPLNHVPAEEMAKTLGDILASYHGEGQAGPKLIPITRLNMLLLISKDPKIFKKAEKFIRKLDLPGGEELEPRIYVYSVKNGEAAELSELLSSIFSGREEKAEDGQVKNVKAADAGATTTEKEGTIKTPFGEVKPKKEKAEAKASKGQAGAQTVAAFATSGSGTLAGEVNITPDEVRNVLIIEALPGDYEIVQGILKRLDVLPRQVLIEVTIAEISVGAKEELGVQWRFDKSDSHDTGLLSASLGEEGLAYTLGLTKKWTQVLNALATQNKVNILSSPSVLASDNKEASINISTEVPVASAQYQYENNNEGLLQTNIQYRNTGVILSVTPHINEHGLVSMDIQQEVSEQSDAVQVGGDSMPSFYNRSVSTSLTVKHGQTIVIGGLIRQTRTRGYSGLPCLGGLPWLKYAAGKNSDSSDKTELILLITPRVIATLDEIDAVTEEFKQKVGKAAKQSFH